jgi:SAM-dependent methyltransferase
MNANKALWEKGDFTQIAAWMRESGEALVQFLGVTTPLRVLDLGCGDGTTAIPMARLGAEVVGIDIARNLVAAGNKRAQEAGLRGLTFQEGDACNLEGVDDRSFDLTPLCFRRHVCSEAVRCSERDGPGHKTRWPHCDGQLDSERSNLRCTVAEDQLVFFAATSGRLHQPDDLGNGYAHYRPLFLSMPECPGRTSPSSNTRTSSFRLARRRQKSSIRSGSATAQP